MTTYRVSEGAPGVSLNKRVYLPGEELPETLTEEAAEQLLKAGTIEKTSAKDKSEDKSVTEQQDEKDADDPNHRADKTTTGGVPIVEQKASTTSQSRTTGTNKPSAK